MWDAQRLADNGKMVAIFKPSTALETALQSNDPDILAATLLRYGVNIRECWTGSDEEYQEIIKNEVFKHKRATPPSSFFEEYSKLLMEGFLVQIKVIDGIPIILLEKRTASVRVASKSYQETDYRNALILAKTLFENKTAYPLTFR